MNENLLFIRDYLDGAIESMDAFVKSNADLPYYSDFCQDVHSNKAVLQTIRDKIGSGLTPYGWTLQKITELGHMFDCYYQLYSSMDFEASLRYSVGFEGYMDILRGVARGYSAGSLGKSRFLSKEEPDVTDESEDPDLDEESSKSSESTKSTKSSQSPGNLFNLQYYPPLKSAAKCVQNTLNLGTNLIITGVNASGKTTTLKTTALNIIFSQQFGFGFYESASLVPYTHIHSYLNIPDTSGRDSLFQAESRRCKEILDKIRDAPADEYHFCIFDELYSGTNPKEATKSAHSLLNYLSQKPNVRFVLTTHYVDVCRKFRKSDVVKNRKMLVDADDKGEFVYTYKMGKGISTLEGGIAILKTMDYPAEIISTIEEDK
jgi:energy-coupling factor transporter ATP-binding protein EcfA2